MTVPLSIRFWAGMHTVVSSRVFILMVVEYGVFAIVVLSRVFILMVVEYRVFAIDDVE